MARRERLEALLEQIEQRLQEGSVRKIELLDAKVQVIIELEEEKRRQPTLFE